MPERINLGRIMPIHRGDYSSNTTYEKMDVVKSGGATYWCKQQCTGVTPPNDTYWVKLADKGEDGTNGQDGADGLDAYQPFKGWYDTSSSLSTAFPTPQVGDYAFVVGASVSDPVTIYKCATAGTWAASSSTFNPANNQEFASGQSLNTVNIVDNLNSSSATDVLSAKQGKALDEKVAALGPKIDGIDEQINGTEGRSLVQPTSNDFIRGYIGTSGKLNDGDTYHILYDVSDIVGYTISASNLPSTNIKYAFISSVGPNGSGNTYYWIVSGYSRTDGAPTNVTIPEGTKYLYLQCGNTSSATVPVLSSSWEQQGENGLQQDVNALKSENAGSRLNALEEINAGTRLDALENIDYDEFVEEEEIIEEVAGKNLANPANFQLQLRFNKNNVNIKKDTAGFGSTGFIPVKEGEWYTFNKIDPSGSSEIWQGGYFVESATLTTGQAAVQGITFTTPVSGGGKCFQVPTGLNITKVLLTVYTDNPKTQITSTNIQLEEGEMATEYEPYATSKKIKKSLLPTSSDDDTPTPSGEFDELTKYTTFGLLNYNGISDKFPNFRRHWILKDKDLVVLNTGTSLTARSSEHCTTKADAAYRPPLMQANNFASYIWDRLMWEGQQYRRYDAKTEQGGSTDMFAEVGTFQTQSNIDAWDDGAYRAGFTRYTDSANASVGFTVPADAWQFNFIYRTDSEGSENAVVTINEGDGVMQVWNGTTWVEANGYTFSMKESAVATLPSVTITNPETGNTTTTLTDVQVKGNTTYQKRLKMRAVTRTATKDVTISTTSGRLLYWGVEWSPREFMITYINAARGSHSSLIRKASSDLVGYQDNEIWSFKPDLLLTEDPIHNSGASGSAMSSHSSIYFANVTENFFFADNHISLKSRCEDLGLTVPEFAIFNSSLTYNFNGFDQDTGELFKYELTDGIVWTALDAQMSCWQSVIINHPNVVYINAVKNWVEAAIACYGNLALATVGSGKDGATFTKEGSHWNDTGCKVMARVVLPVLDFIV